MEPRAGLDQESGEVFEQSTDRQRSIRFDRFVAQPNARILLRDGRPLEIGGRAFDMLMVLLTSRGKIVSKEDIIAYVWPTTTVEESNLRFQMAVLRRVLGNGRNLIKTIPGRGYLLVDDRDETPSDEVAQFEVHAGPRVFTDNEKSLFDAVRTLLVASGRCPSALISFDAAFSALNSSATT